MTSRRPVQLRAVAALVLASVAISVPTAPAESRQVSFNASPAGEIVRFVYRLAHRDTAEQVVSFQLPRQTVERARRAFRRIDRRDFDRAMRQRMTQALDRELAVLRQRWPEARIDRRGEDVAYVIDSTARQQSVIDRAVDRLAAGINRLRLEYPQASIRFDEETLQIGWRGPREDVEAIEPKIQRLLRTAEADRERALRDIEQQDKAAAAALKRDVGAALDAVNKRAEAYRQDYYRRHAYRLIDGKLWPDYQRVARASVPDMVPLARALIRARPRLTARQRVDQALAFLQAIPYDELTSRLTSNGTGFIFPAAMLAENRGDCDTKSVAFAAVVRTLFPDRSVIMVLIPKHAIVGIDLPPRPGDRTIDHGGRLYVLMEPAGPARLPIGRIDPRTESLMRRVLAILPMN